MDWFLVALTIVTVLSGLILLHFHGYRQGRKDGFELGKKKINEYALKVNQAQGERIKELMNEKNTEIEKLAELLSRQDYRKG